jgi:hypothetical protein
LNATNNVLKHAKELIIHKGDNMNIIELAKAHLQNVFTKIQELEQNKQAIESEIEKLKNYASKGLEVVQQEEKNFDKK